MMPTFSKMLFIVSFHQNVLTFIKRFRTPQITKKIFVPLPSFDCNVPRNSRIILSEVLLINFLAVHGLLPDILCVNVDLF